MSRAETIYIGAENRIVRELTRDRSSLSDGDKDSITRVQAWINESLCLDTANPAHQIAYDDGKVTMQLGLVAGLKPGRVTIHLTVFDADHEQGLAWDDFRAKIVTWPKCEE